MILFPDTNFFLHFRDAAELPWNEITSDSEVRLLVCRTVQREIDRKKIDLRGRAQKRARKFATLIGQIIVDRAAIELRTGAPHVTLDYAPRRPSGWTPPDQLREDWDDDMFVADALAFQFATNNKATIITYDVGVYRTALDNELDVIFLGDKPNWMLPDESDDRDKEIVRLKAENSDLRNAVPRIKLDVEVNKTVISEINLNVTRFGALTPDLIGKLMDELKQRHPMVTDFSKPNPRLTDGLAAANIFNAWNGLHEDHPPDAEEISNYTDEAYPNWIEVCQARLSKLQDELERSTSSLVVTFALSNEGSISAESVKLEFSAIGGILLAGLPKLDAASNGEVEQNAISRLPPPPIAPTWKRVQRPNSILALNAALGFDHQGLRLADPFGSNVIARAMASLAMHSGRELDRKPDEFYWTDRPMEGAETCALKCDDFRHLEEPARFNLKIIIPKSKLIHDRPGVKLRLRARNMRTPFEKIIPVRITYIAGDIEAESMKLLPRRPRFGRGNQE